MLLKFLTSAVLIDEFLDLCCYAAERLGRAIVTDGITTPVVNTSAYFFKKTADLIDFKVYFLFFLFCYNFTRSTDTALKLKCQHR